MTMILCVAILVLQVTANPILQGLPTQTCQTCPQNAVRNQYPATPVWPQQSSSNIQPYLQSLLSQNVAYQPLPSSPNPCPYQPQNSPNSCPCQPQNYHPNNNVFSKILSHPSLRTILDPNTKMYNQNGCEVPRNGPCGNSMPSVVNNYIIVPPEFLLDDVKCAKEDNIDVRTKSSNPTRGRKRKKEPVEEAKVQTGGNRRVKDKDDNMRVTKGESGTDKDRKSKRRKNNNPDIKIKVVNENATEPTQSLQEEQKIVLKELIENEITSNNITNLEDSTTNVTPLQTKVKTTSENEDPKNEKQEPKIETEEITEAPCKERPSKSAKINVNVNNECSEKPKRRNSNRPNTNRSDRVKVNTTKAKNTREEAAIQDFRRKFPNIPEELVRKLLDHMKKQLEKQQLGVPAFYYPQYPISYDQLYNPQAVQSSSGTRNVKSSDIQNRTRINRRKGRRRQNKAKKQLNKNAEDCQTIIELTPTVVNEEAPSTEIVPIVETTSQPTTVLTTTEIASTIDAIETTTPNNNDKEYFKVKEDGKEQNLEDFDSEDAGPSYYYPDFYPDFTNDNQYYENDEDYSVKYLQDDRYHYTTDKNYEFEELNRERRKYDPKFLNENEFKRINNRYVFRLNGREQRLRNRLVARPTPPENVTKRPTLKVTLKNEEMQPKTATLNLEDIEITTERVQTTTQEAPIEELIEFKTPPTLETIDFETKPISKEKFYTFSDFSDKVSSYSDAKTPQYSVKEKGDKIKARTKPKDEIETVFARSKVVSYNRPSAEVIGESLIERDDDISQYFTDDKTVVLAKSMDDQFW